MVSNPRRFFELLCHVLRAREKTIVSLWPPARHRLRHDDAGRPILNPFRTTGSLAYQVVLSVTAPIRSPPPGPTVTGDCLPLDLLCDIFVDFSLEELLPLRLVSKTWLAAANSQSAYSRDIDYWHDIDGLDLSFQVDSDSGRLSIDMLKARLACSSRSVRLRIAAAGIEDTTLGEEILSLISQHLHRTELLCIRVHPNLAISTINALRQPAPVLRDLFMDFGVTARIGPDIFLGNAPVLYSLCLCDCAIESAVGYAAFEHVRHLKIQANFPDCVGVARMFQLCPRLEQLDITACYRLPQFPPRDIDITTAPRLNAVRVVSRSCEDQLYVLGALTDPTTRFVSLSIPRDKAAVMMFSQLRGLGPFMFTADNEQSTELHTMQVRVCSLSTSRIREVEVNEFQHWEWPGDFNNSFLLDILEASFLASQITAVHVTLQPEGYSSLSFLSEMQGVWPAVHTVRIDIHKSPWDPYVCSDFPELQQVVLYYPLLPADASSSEMEGICSMFLKFFSFSTRCTMKVVLTRDLRTADIVTLDPQAAISSPLCTIWSWDSIEVDEDDEDDEDDE